MDGVTQALAVMHGAQCYHRDIAPDNMVLLEGSGLPACVNQAQAQDMGNTNRRRWWLLPAGAVADAALSSSPSCQA